MISENARENFVSSVYSLLSDEPTNEKANMIIDFFDTITEDMVELPKEGLLINAPCKLGDTIYAKARLNSGKTQMLTMIVTELSFRQLEKKDSVIVSAIESIHIVGKESKLYKFDSSCFGKVVFTNIEDAMNIEPFYALPQS